MDMISYKQAMSSVEFRLRTIILSFAFHKHLKLLDSVSELVFAVSGLHLPVSLLCVHVYVVRKNIEFLLTLTR